MSWLMRLILAGAVAALAGGALAQPYPTRPVRLLVSFPPGGASDIVARLVGQSLAPRLGQPIVVENRPGSNGNLAGELVAHAPADGYTLLLGPSALFGINPHLYARMPIDPLKELTPVASLVANELILAGPVCAGHHAAGNFGAAARGDQRRPRPAGRRRETCRRRFRRALPDHARRVHRAHPQRLRALWQADQGDRDFGGLGLMASGGY